MSHVWTLEEQDAGSLAAAGPSDLLSVGGRLVPLALAAQLQGGSVNNGGTDLEIIFNEDANWDFALDGVNTGGRTSFVYVAIHEICHGLGFIDSFNAQTGELTNGVPTPFDTFVTRTSGTNNLLVNRGPGEVRSDVVSSDLFFAGPRSIQASLASIRPLPMVKLYAPDPYEKGSSVAHVDQDTYADIRVGLMTPRDFGPGTNIVDSLTAGIMADLGYGLAPGR